MYNINDESFKNSLVYKDFLLANPSIGHLKIRAYTANEAIPIKGIKITVIKKIEGADIVFFDGTTDDSGVIENIPLPAPKLSNTLNTPNSTSYTVIASYKNKTLEYNVKMYENIYAVQTINIVPSPSIGDN